MENIRKYSEFTNIGFFWFWWSATEYAAAPASWARSTGGGDATILKLFNLKNNGYSVRCLKDD